MNGKKYWKVEAVGGIDGLTASESGVFNNNKILIDSGLEELNILFYWKTHQRSLFHIFVVFGVGRCDIKNDNTKKKTNEKCF